MTAIRKAAVAGAAAAALALGAVDPARSQDDGHRALGTAQPIAGSQIEITRVFAYTYSWQPDRDAADPRASYATAECVNFVDHGPKPVAHVLVLFWMVLPQGGRTADEALDVGGPFVQGQEQRKTRPRGAARSFEDDCRVINRALSVVDGALRDDRPDPFAYVGGWITGRHPKPANGALQLMARVEAITFADGTVWRAPAPPPSAPASR